MTFSRYTEKSGPLFKSLKILNIFELNAYQQPFFEVLTSSREATSILR